MDIVAHRGAHDRFPENSIPAFEEAIRLGADGIEFDVRVTKDGVPVVTHWLELEKSIGLPGYLFDMTFKELRASPLLGLPSGSEESFIPTLDEVLSRFAGRTDLEIEVKGPEPEAAERVAEALKAFTNHWPTFEVTSYEPALLGIVSSSCPGLAVDLLFPRSEPWMTHEIVAYLAVGTARLAGARAVHLHPAQLSNQGVDSIRSDDIEIHCWDVNDGPSLEAMKHFGIKRIDTDRLVDALKSGTPASEPANEARKKSRRLSVPSKG